MATLTLGSVNIADMYLGSIQISKAYLGNTLIYNKTSTPPISGDTIELTDIVSYYQQPTQNVVNEINSLSATDYVSFVVLTDMHMNNNSGNSQNIIRYILKNTSANKLFCLGDLSIDQPSLQEYQTAMSPFINNCRNNLYYTRGNHDYPWSSTDEVPLEKLYSDMLEGRSNLIGHPEKLYYYVDDTDKKVRFLVLNTSDEGDENVSNTQLQWIDSAVQLPNSDWKLAVFSHINIDLNHPYLIGAVSQASQIVQKIKATNGTIIGHFCGHQHVDDISVIDNAFYQVVFLADTYEPYYGYADYNVPPDRNVGTVSEQAVSIVSANLNTGDVTIRRIGAGSNQSYNYKSLSSDPGETTSYSITNNLSNCSNGNTATSITSGSSYSATITANSGYTLGTITVTMGGTDITSTVVNGSTINISSVTGNIVITANATANAETPPKEWTSGVAYNLSIVADSYVEKDGAITAYTDWSRTDYTNCAGASKLVTNSTWEANYCCFYDSNKNFISTFTIPNGNGEITVPSNASYFIASAETSVMVTMVITPYSAT